MQAANLPAVRAARTPSSAPPHLVVAHGWRGPSGAMGLDRPLPMLGGGDLLAPSGIAGAAGMEHLPAFRSLVADACREQASRGADCFHLRPLALTGPAGVGRGLAARWLARVAGVPLVRLDPRRLVERDGVDPWPSEQRMPPDPAVAIAASGCANPIILIDLEDDMPDRAAARLATMMDDRLNGRWLDEDLGLILDLSQVTWIVQSTALHPTVAGSLDSCGTRLDVRHPSGIASGLRNLAIAAEAVPGSRADDRRSAVFSGLEEAVAAKGPHATVPCADLCRLARQLAADRAGVEP